MPYIFNFGHLTKVCGKLYVSAEVRALYLSGKRLDGSWGAVVNRKDLHLPGIKPLFLGHAATSHCADLANMAYLHLVKKIQAY